MWRQNARWLKLWQVVWAICRVNFPLYAINDRGLSTLVLDKLAAYWTDFTLAGECMRDDSTFRHIRCERYLLTKISRTVVQIVSFLLSIGDVMWRSRELDEDDRKRSRQSSKRSLIDSKLWFFAPRSSHHTSRRGVPALNLKVLKYLRFPRCLKCLLHLGHQFGLQCCKRKDGLWICIKQSVHEWMRNEDMNVNIKNKPSLT